MNLSELLNGPMGQLVAGTVADQLGIDKQQATGVVDLAVPAILEGIARNAQSPKGAESLYSALESKHDGSLLDNLMGILQGNSLELQEDGNGILGHVFGNDRTTIEQGLSQKAGVSLNKIGPLLSTLAPVVMAYLGKEKRQANTDAGGLGNLLSGFLGGQSQSQSGGGILDMLSSALDKDGDGNPLNDILDGFLGGR